MPAPCFLSPHFGSHPTPALKERPKHPASLQLFLTCGQISGTALLACLMPCPSRTSSLCSSWVALRRAGRPQASKASKPGRSCTTFGMRHAPALRERSTWLGASECVLPVAHGGALPGANGDALPGAMTTPSWLGRRSQKLPTIAPGLSWGASRRVQVCGCMPMLVP